MIRKSFLIKPKLTSSRLCIHWLQPFPPRYQRKPALSGSGNPSNGQTSGGSTGWESYWEGYVPSTGTTSKPQEEEKENVSDNAGTSSGGTVWQNPWLSAEADTQVQQNQGEVKNNLHQGYL